MKTKKSSANQPAGVAAATATKLKKNINRTPIKMKLHQAPSGGIVESFNTAVVDIVISIVSRNGTGAFIKPQVDAWRSGNDYCLHWNIDGVMNRRDVGNEPMRSNPSLPYPWDCIVTLRDSEEYETPESIGTNLAIAFSSFSTPEYEKRTFQFKADISDDPPLSLNNYLLDRDCVVYMKKIFFGVAKNEIMEDEETLTQFFGSPEEGWRVLNDVSDVEWESQVW